MIKTFSAASSRLVSSDSGCLTLEPRYVVAKDLVDAMVLVRLHDGVEGRAVELPRVRLTDAARASEGLARLDSFDFIDDGS